MNKETSINIQQIEKHGKTCPALIDRSACLYIDICEKIDWKQCSIYRRYVAPMRKTPQDYLPNHNL